MKLFIITFFAVAAVADRLENTYLPPGSARTAAGNGHFLNAPFNGGSQSHFGHEQGAPSGTYGAPGFGSRGAQRPSGEYGAPSGHHGAPAGSNLNHFGQAPSGNYGAPSSGNFGGSSGRFGNFAQSREARAGILRYNNENYGDGTYRFEYETENGISQQESGELKNAGSDYESSAVRGSYTYTGDDGQTYTVNYIADENGFQPFGEHIATISQAVQTSLQKNAAAEAQQGYQYNGQGQGSGSGNYQQGGFHQGGSREYLAPDRQSFNQQSGYQY